MSNSEDLPGMEILYDIEEIDKRAIKYLLDAKEKFDNCIDSAGPSAMVSAQYLWDTVVEVKKKDVKIRFITEITKDNLSPCKTMRQSENFGIWKESKVTLE